MKRIKEIQPLLVAIYVLNELNEKEKISLLAEYGLHELCDANSNMIKPVTHFGKKEDLLKETEELLENETKFYDFVKKKEALKKNN